MDDLISKIEEGEELDHAVDYFFSLPHAEKIQFLEKFHDTRSEDAGVYLNVLLRRAQEKDVQKLLKKLLFRLKTRGVHVDEPMTSGESVLKKIEIIRDVRAFMSNYDNEATRAVLLAVEVRRRQYLFVHAICHFSEGLADMAVLPLPLSELDTLVADYTEKTQPPMVLAPISPSYAAYLIEEAAGRSGKFTEEMKGLRSLATSLKGDVRKPADIAALRVPEDVEAKSAEEALAHSMFEPMSFSWNSLDEDRKALADLLNPSIVLPPYMMEEKKREFFRMLLEKDAIGTRRSDFRRMLEDYAYLFFVTGEFGFFRGVVERLGEESFVDALMAGFIAKALEKKEDQSEQPGVLVNPFQPGPGQPPLPRR